MLVACRIYTRFVLVFWLSAFLEISRKSLAYIRKKMCIIRISRDTSFHANLDIVLGDRKIASRLVVYEVL